MSKSSFGALIVAILLAGCSPTGKPPGEAGSADKTAAESSAVVSRREEAAKPEPRPQSSVAPVAAAAAPPASVPPARSRAQPVAEAKLATGAGAPASLAGHSRELDALRAPSQPTDRESYAQIEENPVKRAAEQPVSTFSIDVDTASYANARRFLSAGQLPPPDSVRIEEFVNYFPYRYASPGAESGSAPFAVHLEAAPNPFESNHHLVRVGNIHTFDELLAKHGKGLGCDICKPAAASVLARAAGPTPAPWRLWPSRR